MEPNIEIIITKGVNDKEYKATKQYAAIPEIEDNTIVVKASPYGQIDRYGDVIAPGFFKPLIKGFLTTGFVAMAHDWKNPVGMPIAAKDSAEGLFSTAEFHSTEAGQNARTIAVERAEKGLQTGVSVAFSCAPGGYAWFQDGAAMIDFMKGAEMDLTGYDVKGIQAYDSYCRLLVKGDQLFEWSIALVPVNVGASVIDAKGLGDNSHAGLPLDEHLVTSLAVVRGASARLLDYSIMKAKDGRAASPARLTEAESLYAELGALIAKMKAPPIDADAERIARAKEREARYRETKAAILTN